MEPLEIEVKYFLGDYRSVRDLIISHGGVSKGRAFEVNYRYDDSENRLRKRGTLLRLRRDRTSKLTFKSRPPVEYSGVKVHSEYEVEVEDFDTMNQIIEKLGFFREQIYEKWREVFTLGNCELCVDNMPFGDFLEIEGGYEDITKVSEQLGFTFNKRITATYLEIFERIRAVHGLSFHDITFDNFRELKIDFSQFLHHFELKDSA